MRVGRIRQDVSTQCSGQKGKFRPHSEFDYFTSVFSQFSIVKKNYRFFSIKFKFFKEIEKSSKCDFTKAVYLSILIEKVKKFEVNGSKFHAVFVSGCISYINKCFSSLTSVQLKNLH